MLTSLDSLTILDRMLVKLENTSTASHSTIISAEEKQLLQNLLENYATSNDSKLLLILKIFSTYLKVLDSNNPINSETTNSLKEIIKSVRFNEIELFLPCNDIEWILLEIGKLVLLQSSNNTQKMYILDDLLETTTELFKIVKNDYGLAIANYLWAYKWFLEGNKEKASRLLEMVAHTLKEPLVIWETQYYAAIMIYKNNLRRAINLLENCVLLGQKFPKEISKSSITSDSVDETLNKLRREFIIRDHDDPDKSFLFKVIDNVIHYYYNKNDLYGLSACYYESGVIFDKLGYEDTAEEYFIESAIITSDLQEWLLYSKSLINLVVKFFEKGKVREAEDYLNDLIQVASFLKDEKLHKKVETLLLSLKKLKEIKPSPITPATNIEKYISEIDASNQPLLNQYQPETFQHEEYSTNLEPEEELDLLESLDTLSRFSAQPKEPINQNTIPETPNQEYITNVNENTIDQSFLTDFKEPITPIIPNEVVISNEGLLTPLEPVSSNKKDDKNTFYGVRKKICSILKEGGFEIFTDYKPIKGSVSVDIVALKGKIRKQKLFIMIAADGEGEIELSANLLVSIFDSAERVVFVNTRDPKPSEKRGGVLVIYDIEDLPV